MEHSSDISVNWNWYCNKNRIKIMEMKYHWIMTIVLGWLVSWCLQQTGH